MMDRLYSSGYETSDGLNREGVDDGDRQMNVHTSAVWTPFDSCGEEVKAKELQMTSEKSNRTGGGGSCDKELGKWFGVRARVV